MSELDSSEHTTPENSVPDGHGHVMVETPQAPAAFAPVESTPVVAPAAAAPQAAAVPATAVPP
ncbi:MAG: dihydrolipoamide succinyltransferase, partial [Protaetiibacter sp.]